MAIKHRQCPKCGSNNSMKILYGEPNGEAIMLEVEGKIKLGGCLITDISPEYFCKDCENEWSKKEAIDHAYSKIKGLSFY